MGWLDTDQMIVKGALTRRERASLLFRGCTYFLMVVMTAAVGAHRLTPWVWLIAAPLLLWMLDLIVTVATAPRSPRRADH